MKRRDFLGASVAVAAALRPLAGAAQKAMPVVGLLHSLSEARTKPQIAAFREGLREAGYVLGRNLAIEYRWADGQYDRLPELAADLVRRNIDVIATGGGTVAALAAKNATSTIPIVLCLAGDPVRTGVVASLARPGGNITGVGLFSLDLLAKRIELLSELVPQAKAVGLMVNPDNPTSKIQIRDAQEVVGGKGLQLHILKARTKEEIEAALGSLAALRADALVVGADGLLYHLRDRLAALALSHAMPAIYELREHVDAGGLISYGNNVVDAYRQAARLIARILAGARPSDIPVEQPTKFELVINLKTANALGLTIPQSLLARADEVIE